MKEYPKTLEAVQQYEGGAWAVADALLEEIEVKADGVAQRGEFTRLQAYLAKNDYEVGTDWLRSLHAVAEWAAEMPGLEHRLREYGPRNVKTAKAKAKSDHVVALEILAEHGGKLHAIAGSNAVGDVSKLSTKQAEKLQGDLLTKRPEAFQQVVGEKPGALDNAMADDKTRMRVRASEARVREATASKRKGQRRQSGQTASAADPSGVAALKVVQRLTQIREAVATFARDWPELLSDLNDEAYELCRDRIAEEQVLITKVFGAVLGTDIEATLDKILGEEVS